MNKTITVISGVAMAVAAALSHAQESALDEIVVTAQRRSENLQSVPVTVTAVSNEQLAASGVTNVQQLSSLVPSLSVVDPTGYTMAFIRGIGSSTLGAGTFSSVATYVDGVYIARTTNAMFELDAVDSVQVLAGPQGALYGRNATAGAIVITSPRPTPGSDFEGNASVTVGSFNRLDVSSRVAFGLGDNSAMSIEAASHDRDGYVKNLNPYGNRNTEDLDDRDAMSAGLSFVFNPSDATSIALRAAYSRSNDHSSGGYEAVGQGVPGPIPGFNDNRSALFGGIAQVYGPVLGAATPAIAAQGATNAIYSTKFRQSYDNQGDAFSAGLLKGTHKPGSSLFIENLLVALNMEFDLGNMVVRSVTGYTDSDYHGSVGVSLEKPGSATSTILGGGQPAPLNANGGLGFSSINPSEVFSQGIQLLSADNSNIRWIAGVDYSKEDGQAVLTGDFFGFNLYSADNVWGVESSAVFGQATIPFSSDWAATVGARFTDETYDINDKYKVGNPQYLPGVNVGKKKKTSSKFTYTARLERKGDDWLAYGGVVTGFKSATLNVNSPAQGQAEPEEVTSFEIGFKRDFTSTFRLNAAAYFSQYDNIQINRIEQSTGANVLDNGPAAEVTGLDLQALAKVNSNFELGIGLTALNAEFTENKPGQTIKGNKLPGSADLAASVVGNLSVPFGSGSLDWTTTLSYNSGKYYDQLNLVGSGGANDDSYALVNMNLTYRTADDRLSFSVFGNNLTDEQYYRTGIIAFGFFGRAAIAGNPANYGATVNFKF